MVILANDVYHMYVTLNTYMKYSSINLLDTPLLMSMLSRGSVSKKLKSLTPLDVATLIKTNPCSVGSCNEKYKDLKSIEKEINKAQEDHRNTTFGVDTLYLKSWDAIPQPVPAPQVASQEDPIPTTNPATNPTLEQQLAEAIAKQSYYKGFVVQLMKYIDNDPSITTNRGHIAADIKSIASRQAPVDTPLKDYLDAFFNKQW